MGGRKEIVDAGRLNGRSRTPRRSPRSSSKEQEAARTKEEGAGGRQRRRGSVGVGLTRPRAYSRARNTRGEYR